MKTTVFLLGALALSIGTARAGPCTTEIENLTKLMASRDAGSGPTAGGSTASPSESGEAPREQHPPTAAMSRATQGGAASPQDVQSQIRGGPTAVQQQEGVRRPAAENLAAAQTALELAREFDRTGKEDECMDAVQRAKRLVP
jgi:hypothetical protein